MGVQVGVRQMSKAVKGGVSGVVGKDWGAGGEGGRTVERGSECWVGD